MNWLRHMLGIRSEEEIIQEVESEPSIRKARESLRRADAILIELEKVERGPYRARNRRRGDRKW